MMQQKEDLPYSSRANRSFGAMRCQYWRPGVVALIVLLKSHDGKRGDAARRLQWHSMCYVDLVSRLSNDLIDWRI